MNLIIILPSIKNRNNQGVAQNAKVAHLPGSSMRRHFNGFFWFYRLSLAGGNTFTNINFYKMAKSVRNHRPIVYMKNGSRNCPRFRDYRGGKFPLQWLTYKENEK